MQTPPQSPGSTLTYVLSGIVLALATGIGAAFSTLLGRRRSTSTKENAEARHIDGTTVELAWTRMDQMQKRIDEQAAELLELRNVKQQLADWKSYARRCEQRLQAHKIAAPEFWESGERVG